MPNGQSKTRPPADAWIDTLAGGLTATVTIAGTEVQPARVSVTS